MNTIEHHRTRRMAAAATLLFLGGALTGCGAARMALRYGDLETRTELSQSVFLELRSDAPPSVHVVEHSTAGSDLSIRPALEGGLVRAGYVLVDDPRDATYVMQINHRSMIETEIGDGGSLGDAVSGALAAGTVAGVAADLAGAGPDAATGVGLGVGLVGFLIDSRVKHVAHLLTTDLVVTEQVGPEGAAGAERRHEVTAVSGASKMNLGRAEALPAILRTLGVSLADLLPPRAAAREAPLAADGTR
ncbi:MAG TPA: complement resistance protein TraT [Longimicrobiales bacterium]|nr:complement resistance protein TraT [Longimicrobiales bacterium]